MRTRSAPAWALLLLAFGACGGAPSSPGTEAASEPGGWNYEEHVIQRAAEIDATPVETGGALFVGDSITRAGEDWSRWFPGVATSNHGVGGDQTSALLARMEQITRGTPERVFLMIGTNDLSTNTAAEAAEGALTVARTLRRRLPDAQLYVQSVLPREADKARQVLAVNEVLEREAGEAGYVYLDLYPHFATAEGTLRPELTSDDLHLEEEGYALWAALIDDCVWAGCEGL